ncbi:hypothetical protein SpCBS45565_g03941 [Spizellomyces sp. 'palustris']|nr:hypothetical protein SpCBS45565_g03941 [Spizellomyces sp. 'palustris']
MRLSLRIAVLVAFIVLLLDIPSVLAGSDYYGVLGVDRSATKRQIKKAYKELSKKHHPDKNPGDKDAEAKFVELAQAYEVLADDEKRRIYDQYGEEGLKGGGHQQFHNPFDIFAQFAGFGGGFGFGHQHAQQRKGPEVAINLEVTLEELFLGTTIEVEINKQIICPTCRGLGAKRAEDVVKCTACNGAGIRIVRQMLGPGMYQQMQTTCDACGGRGKLVKSKCPACEGNKVKRGSHQLTVTIERGMYDGQQIVMDREADESPDTTPGDLIFTLNTLPHPTFTRKGDNLYVKEVITLKEALLGFEKKLKHLDGNEITIRREGITQPEFVQTINGQGMPTHEFPSERGFLYVEYGVVFPEKLTDAQISQIGKLFDS